LPALCLPQIKHVALRDAATSSAGEPRLLWAHFSLVSSASQATSFLQLTNQPDSRKTEFSCLLFYPGRVNP